MTPVSMSGKKKASASKWPKQITREIRESERAMCYRPLN
jgi:hypothetical protein